MDKSVIQTLNGLVPTLSDPLPPELPELALSLLAQSRNKASNLKAEEEIARSYACAHIACERLKQSLNIPKIHPRPPCPPKVYQRLYRYLDSSLQASTRRSTRIPAPIKSASAPASASFGPSAKRNIPTKPSSTLATVPKPPISKPLHPSDRVPEWIMPSIRLLCNALNAPTAPPHIFAGVSSILTLPPPIPPTSPARNSPNIKLPALIIAIALIVYTRLSGTATPACEYAHQKSLGLAVLAESIPKDVAQNEPVDVDAWFREIRDRGWTQCDWFANVPEGAGLDMSSSAGEANNSTNQETETQQTSTTIYKDKDLDPTIDDQSVLLPGLGTMMQPHLDFLSASRRHEFKVWKKDFLERIERAEAEMRA